MRWRNSNGWAGHGTIIQMIQGRKSTFGFSLSCELVHFVVVVMEGGPWMEQLVIFAPTIVKSFIHAIAKSHLLICHSNLPDDNNWAIHACHLVRPISLILPFVYTLAWVGLGLMVKIRTWKKKFLTCVPMRMLFFCKNKKIDWYLLDIIIN